MREDKLNNVDLKDQLKNRHKHHLKFQKGCLNPFGGLNEDKEMDNMNHSLSEAKKKKYHVNTDAGNVEHNINMFNMANTVTEGPSCNPCGPMAESVDNNISESVQRECELCGHTLTDAGQCPVCDLGDEDARESHTIYTHDEGDEVDESLNESTQDGWESADYYDVRLLPVGTKVRITDTDWGGDELTIEAYVLGGDRDSNYVRITRDESDRFDTDSRYYEEIDIDCITDVYYEESVFNRVDESLNEAKNNKYIDPWEEYYKQENVFDSSSAPFDIEFKIFAPMSFLDRLAELTGVSNPDGERMVKQLISMGLFQMHEDAQDSKGKLYDVFGVKDKKSLDNLTKKYPEVAKLIVSKEKSKDIKVSTRDKFYEPSIIPRHISDEKPQGHKTITHLDSDDSAFDRIGESINETWYGYNIFSGSHNRKFKSEEEYIDEAVNDNFAFWWDELDHSKNVDDYVEIFNRSHLEVTDHAIENNEYLKSVLTKYIDAYLADDETYDDDIDVSYLGEDFEDDGSNEDIDVNCEGCAKLIKVPAGSKGPYYCSDCVPTMNESYSITARAEDGSLKYYNKDTDSWHDNRDEATKYDNLDVAHYDFFEITPRYKDQFKRIFVPVFED